MVSVTNIEDGTIMDGFYYHGNWVASSEARGTRLELVGFSFEGVFFGSDISFDSIVLSECTFNRCSFVESDFHAAFLATGKFDHCDFLRVTLRKASVNNSTFRNCRFNEVKFGKSDLSDSVFLDCLISGCDFVRAFLGGARFVDCTIEGAEALADIGAGGAELSGVRVMS